MSSASVSTVGRMFKCLPWELLRIDLGTLETQIEEVVRANRLNSGEVLAANSRGQKRTSGPLGERGHLVRQNRQASNQV